MRKLSQLGRQADPQRSATTRVRAFFRTAVYVIAAAVIGTALCRTTASGPPEGSVAPRFQLVAVSPQGPPLSLDTLKGQPILIEVFASWCPSCRSATPIMDRLFNDGASRKARFVAVSVDESLERARAAASAWNIPFPVGLDDGSFSRSYRIKSLPTFILIDTAGRVRHVSTGVTSERRLRAWLEDS